jgi:hypothetical protein
MPMRERHAVRGLLLNPTGELLMMRFMGPTRAVWITLGGGLQSGEAARDGLARELTEETLRGGWDIGPEVWTRSARFELRGETVLQHERYFLVHTPHFEPPDDMPDPVERQVFGGFRWWSPGAIRDSAERFAPSRLGDCLTRLLQHGPPGRPVDVGR